MKKTFLIVIGLLLSLIIGLNSCSISIEKRRYNKGYHIDFSKNKIPKKQQEKRLLAVKTEQELNNKAAVDTVIIVAKVMAELGSVKPKKEEEIFYTSTSEFIASPNPKSPIKVRVNNEHQKQTLKLGKKKEKDNSLYFLSGIIALAGFGLLRKKKKNLLRATKWANKNKIKSRGLIAFAQSSIVLLGVSAGKDMYHLGYIFSNNIEYVFGGLMLVGFLGLLNKKNKMFNIKQFDRSKMSHLAISLSLFMLALNIGNKTNAGIPQVSPLGNVVEKVEKLHFSAHKTLNKFSENGAIEKQLLVKPDDEKEIRSDYDRGTYGLMIFGSILLGIALCIGIVALACSLACQGQTGLALLTLFGGGLLVALLIRAMIIGIKKTKYVT